LKKRRANARRFFVERCLACEAEAVGAAVPCLENEKRRRQASRESSANWDFVAARGSSVAKAMADRQRAVLDLPWLHFHAAEEVFLKKIAKSSCCRYVFLTKRSDQRLFEKG
jgi:hypothetical protein